MQKPGVAGPSGLANPAVGEAFGAQSVHFCFFCRRDPSPIELERDLTAAFATAIPLLAGVCVPISHGGDATALRAAGAVYAR